MKFQKVLRVKGSLHGLIEHLAVKLRCRPLILPSARMHIIVNAQKVHEAVRHGSARFRKTGFQHLLRPVRIRHVRSATYLEKRLVRMILTAVGLIPAIKIRIVFRRHVAAAAPVLIADAEIVDSPWLLMSVFFT